MTIPRIERLVRRVRAALQTGEPGGAAMAGELAEVCREANRRIEQCTGSLRRGDFGAALDLSEAEPTLAEQMRILNFAEFETWAQKCREQGWPIAEAPDQRGFQGLQKLLQEAKGKEADPALVESYRAAMLAGDRPAALRVLATILRRRPGDAWAQGEKGKLLAKESELSLRRMEALLAAGDDGALAAEVDKFTQLGLESKYRPEIFEAARQRRQERRREEAQVRVRDWLRQAEERREAGDWRGVEDWLETAAAELEEAGARPPSGNLWNDLHQWVREKRVEAEQKEQLRKQEERVYQELEALELLRRDGTRRPAGRLREALATVEEFLNLPGTGGALWPEAVHRRLRQEAELLVLDLRRARRRQWLWAGGLTAVAVLAAAGLAQWKQEEIRQQLFLAKIDQMIADRQVEEAQAWLTSEEAQRAAGGAEGAAELAKLRSFLEQEEQARAAATEELARLEKISAERKVPLAERWRGWGDFEKRLAALHPPWRRVLEERRDRAQADLRTESRELRETRFRQLEKEMKEVEGKFAEWERKQQNRPEDLEKIQPLLDQLADGVAWKEENDPELAMPEEVERKFTALLGRLAEARARLEDFLQSRQALTAAATAAEYRRALERYTAQASTPAAEKEKISQVLEAWKEEASLLSHLWLPWESEPPARTSAQLFPSRLEGAEEKMLQEIAEDDFLHDIWLYDVPEAKDSKDRYRLYSRGKLKVIPGSGSEAPYTFGQGEVFIPRESARDEPVHFENRTRSQDFMGLRQDTKLLIGFAGQVRASPEPNSEALRGVRENLEKALSADGVAPLARAPLHEAMERLLPNQPGTSPLARAYLVAKMWKLATVAKDPGRFGLIFSPTLRKLAAEWAGWGTVEPGVWLKEDVADVHVDWVRALGQAEAPPFVAEAKLAGQLWSRAGKAGLAYGGSVDDGGKGRFDRLVNLEPGQILIGQGLKGEPVVGWHYDGSEWKPRAKVRPFSPLFLFARNPETLLRESVREARVPEEWARGWVRQHLPMILGAGSQGSGGH